MTATSTTELGLTLTQKVARVKVRGWQECPVGHPDYPGVTLYNVISGDGLCVGSTVVLSSLEKRGFKVEVVS